jgi:hypothetical protein
MSDKNPIAPRISWKDMQEPMPLEDYAAQRMQEQADQPADLSALGEFPWETIYAAFDPDRLQDDRYKGKNYVYTADDINRINENMPKIAVGRGARKESLHFFVRNPDGSLELRDPVNGTTSRTTGRHGETLSDKASGGPPPGTALGVHGHIPGTAGFADFVDHKTPYGDSGALSHAEPFPMATVAQPMSGPYRGQNMVGVHEMVNGRLQFRAPLGAMSDDDRRRLQHNLDRSQEKFYK